jgi:hypothetical protein
MMPYILSFQPETDAIGLRVAASVLFSQNPLLPVGEHKKAGVHEPWLNLMDWIGSKGIKPETVEFVHDSISISYGPPRRKLQITKKPAEGCVYDPLMLTTQLQRARPRKHHQHHHDQEIKLDQYAMVAMKMWQLLAFVEQLGPNDAKNRPIWFPVTRPALIGDANCWCGAALEFPVAWAQSGSRGAFEVYPTSYFPVRDIDHEHGHHSETSDDHYYVWAALHQQFNMGMHQNFDDYPHKDWVQEPIAANRKRPRPTEDMEEEAGEEGKRNGRQKKPRVAEPHLQQQRMVIQEKTTTTTLQHHEINWGFESSISVPTTASGAGAATSDKEFY